MPVDGSSEVDAGFEKPETVSRSRMKFECQIKAEGFCFYQMVMPETSMINNLLPTNLFHAVVYTV